MRQIHFHYLIPTLSNGLVYQPDRKPKSFLLFLFLFFLKLVSRTKQVFFGNCLSLDLAVQLLDSDFNPDLRIYLSKSQNVSVKITKCICPNIQICFSKKKGIFQNCQIYPSFPPQIRLSTCLTLMTMIRDLTMCEDPMRQCVQ